MQISGSRQLRSALSEYINHDNDHRHTAGSDRRHRFDPQRRRRARPPGAAT
jgi:hypothetical protein